MTQRHPPSLSLGEKEVGTLGQGAERKAGPQKALWRPGDGFHHRGAADFPGIIHPLSAGHAADRQRGVGGTSHAGRVQPRAGHGTLPHGVYQHAGAGLHRGAGLYGAGPVVCLCGRVCKHPLARGAQDVQYREHAAGGVPAVRVVAEHDSALWPRRHHHAQPPGHLRQQHLRPAWYRHRADPDILPRLLHDAQGPAQKHRPLSGGGQP